MPLHEFLCKNDHLTEKLFLTFGAVTETIDCPKCGETAQQQLSVPLPAIFYGDGWYKPAASGRTSTRMGDPSKAAKEVVEEIGGKNLVQGVKGKQ